MPTALFGNPLATGVDLDPSQWFTPITWGIWGDIAEQGFSYAYVRLTMVYNGKVYVAVPDRPGFLIDWGRGGKAAGLAMGAIHPLSSSMSGRVQARQVAALYNTSLRGFQNPSDKKLIKSYFDSPPALWVKTGASDPPAALCRVLIEYLHEWAVMGLEAPTIAVSSADAAAMKLAEISNLGDYPLWVIDHASTDAPQVPAPWTSYVRWQTNATHAIGDTLVGVNKGPRKANVPQKKGERGTFFTDPRFVTGAALLVAGVWAYRVLKIKDRRAALSRALGE